MTAEIRLFFERFKNRPIVKNLVALSFLQLTNYLLPLAIIPYIIRTIGVERFGLISFAQALMVFFSVITDYGFNLTSTRDISISRDNHRQISAIVSATFSTKILLGLITFILTLLATVSFEKLNQDPFLFIGAFCLVIGQLMLPIWFFQGMEKMQYMTYLNLLAKVITVVLLFLLVKKGEDYILILPIYAVGNIVAAIVSLYIIRHTFKIHFSFSSFSTILDQLKHGFSIFASSVSVSLYNSSIILILGIFASNLTIGYYSTAEKVTLVVRQLLSVFSQAIYPHLCKLALSGMEEVNRFWKKVFVPFLFAIFLLCTAILAFADQLVLFLIGHHSAEASLLIKLLAYTPFIVATNIPSYQTLLALDLRNQCLGILASASVLNIAMNIIMSHYFEAVGTAATLLITETYISIGLFIILSRSTRKFTGTINNGNL